MNAKNTLVSFKELKVSSKSDKTLDVGTFPLVYKKSKPVKTLRNIIHRLQRTKGQYSEVSIEDRLNQLIDPTNKSWHALVKVMKERGIKYSRALRVVFAYVKLRYIFIDDDIQRELNIPHVLKIANLDKFAVPLMAPIQGIKEVGNWRFHSTNSQHTVVLEAALAHGGFWDGFDGDWRDLEVPFLYIETDDRYFARQQFDVFNGKGAKKLSPYDNHRKEVLFYRLDGSMDTEHKQSDELQTICEDNGYEPLSDDNDDNTGHPKVINHVSAMRKYKEKPKHWEFILKTHSEYWPNMQIDGMEIDLYGFMYEYFKVKMKVNVYSKEFIKDFLGPFHAIIQNLFITPKILSSESANTFTRWYATSWDVAVKDAQSKIEAQASFVLLMKIYRILGGTHPLPDIVDLYDNNRAKDLTEHLSNTIKQTIKAVTP